MCNQLPTSVRYVKNGKGGQWWKAAQMNGQVHLGWKEIPHELLLNADFAIIEQKVKDEYGSRRVRQEVNALHYLLDAPSQYIWVTFEEGCMWWCTVQDGVIVNSGGETTEKGHFWLNCNRRWSKSSLKGKLFAISDLPGTVTTVAGFRAAVCKPKYWESILRLINGEADPRVAKAAEARREYELAVRAVVQRIGWKDFEHLIDLILTRSGWDRISSLGNIQEGIDMEVENGATDEIAFVQVKSQADQKELDKYVERFNKRRDRCARMIFAVHTPNGTLTAPANMPVQLWTGERVAKLVVRAGLGKWVENRLA